MKHLPTISRARLAPVLMASMAVVANVSAADLKQPLPAEFAMLTKSDIATVCAFQAGRIAAESLYDTKLDSELKAQRFTTFTLIEEVWIARSKSSEAEATRFLSLIDDQPSAVNQLQRNYCVVTGGDHYELMTDAQRRLIHQRAAASSKKFFASIKG